MSLLSATICKPRPSITSQLLLSGSILPRTLAQRAGHPPSFLNHPTRPARSIRAKPAGRALKPRQLRHGQDKGGFSAKAELGGDWTVLKSILFVVFLSALGNDAEEDERRHSQPQEIERTGHPALKSFPWYMKPWGHGAGSGGALLGEGF